MKKIILVFVLLSAPIFAQIEYSQGVVPLGEYPGFYIDAANYKGETKEKTRIDIYFQIPYANLQFVKHKGKFRAKYSYTLTIYDEDKDNIVIEKIWNGKIFAKNFKEASSENNFQFGFKSFNLAPNNYVLSSVLYDKDSKKEFKTEAKLEIRDFNKPLQFSDILFIASEIDSQIVLNISNTITTSDSSLFFYYEIYSDTSTKVNIEYSVISEHDNIVFKNNELLFVDAGSTQIKKKLDKSKISLGKHKLIIKAVDENKKTIDGVSKVFLSQIKGFPASVIDIDLSISQMVYIANVDEIDEMLNAKTEEEKLSLFKAFWKKKDPEPSTPHNKVMEEYYRRVAYANKNFKHYYDGWKTDMGMIYITLGPPDNVDRHPFELNGKPYEVWQYYNISQNFYFIDDTGFGDYRLLNPNYGDWYRYRQ